MLMSTHLDPRINIKTEWLEPRTHAPILSVLRGLQKKKKEEGFSLLKKVLRESLVT